MFNRREFLTRTLKGATLLSVGTVVPRFIAETARAAEAGKDTVLVVVEMGGGNDGLNTVIPYADDLYHKFRPTLHYTKDQVVRLDDHVGLHPGMGSLRQLWQQEQLAVLLGVGYPNPDRSHFEAMDIWQSADPRRALKNGWLGRAGGDLQGRSADVAIMHIGPNRLPLALQGAPGGGAISVNNNHPYHLDLGGGTAAQHKARRRLLEDISKPAAAPLTPHPSSPGERGEEGDLLAFVQRRQVQTLTTIERMEEALRMPAGFQPNALSQKLQLIAQLIQRGFGTRVYYAAIDGFDTHANQAPTHQKLLAELAESITQFFNVLKGGGHDKRVRLLTFSEFGRRVQENGSKGTDHGAASCLFVAGAGAKGVIGKHPRLDDLDAGDLKYGIDFRSVYATLLDGWLGCDSRAVLGKKWDPIDALKVKV
jgi:uncharacterized protein (DUF1501 family)